MTNEEIMAVTVLRKHNYSYSFISRELGVSGSTVKAYCKRHQIVPEMPRKTKKEMRETRLCKNCHLFLPEGIRSDALFCCNNCRTRWNRKRHKLLRMEEQGTV